MSDFFPLFLLTAALCADAFTASFLYGTCGVRIPRSSAWILSILSTGILALFLLAGNLLRPFFPGRTASLLSASLLTVLGLFKLAARPTKDTADKANKQTPEILSPKEAFFLSLALSADSAAAGLGVGLSSSSIPLLLGLSLILSTLAVMAGGALGKRAKTSVSIDFSKSGGIVLILLGLFKLI